MQARIDQWGRLIILADSETERYALQKWSTGEKVRLTIDVHLDVNNKPVMEEWEFIPKQNHG